MFRYLIPGLLMTLFVWSNIRSQSSMFRKVFTGADGAIEEVDAIITDTIGNMYVTGSFSSGCTIGNDTLSITGYETVFFAKCDPSGGFLWAVAPDCSYYAYGAGLAVDNDGSLYVTGSFMGELNFDNGIGLTAPYFSTFLAKFDTSGQIMWAKAFSCDQSNTPRSIALNAEGIIYLAGQFEGDLIYGSDSLYSFNTACFVLKADEDGNGIWMVQSEGDGDTYPQSLAIDPYGSVVLTGIFINGTAFGSYILPGYSPGYSGYDIFICKLSTAGEFLWAVQAGGPEYDEGYTVVCNNDGSILINGHYTYQAHFGSIMIATGGDTYSADAYVAKLNFYGSFMWAKSYDISCFTNNLMITDTDKNIYLTGNYSGSKEIGPSRLQWYGYDDVFVIKMDQEGQVQWAKGAGSQNEDFGRGIALLPDGELAVAGYLSPEAAFDSITPSNNHKALFVAMLNQFGPLVFSEICYKPASDTNTGEWVEIYNAGSEAIDLSGWTLKDGNDNNQFTIPSPTLLDAGQYLVLCQDLQKFRQFHPTLSNVVGSFEFELAPNGEKVRFFDDNGLLIVQAYYRSVSPWPDLSDGRGRTLELRDAGGELSDGTNWFAGCPGGSPGSAYFDCATAGLDKPDQSDQQLFLLPNPAAEFVDISFDSPHSSEAELVVYDQAGKIVKKEIYGTIRPGDNILHLSIKDLPSGIYLISLTFDGKRYSGKFIKYQ
jgi:hypothetical protein